MAEYVDETHQRIAEFAEEFLDDDDEREGFVDGLMERLGYQRLASWGAPAPRGGGQSGGPRPLLQQRQRQPRASGGGGGGGQQQQPQGSPRGSYFRGPRAA